MLQLKVTNLNHQNCKDNQQMYSGMSLMLLLPQTHIHLSMGDKRGKKTNQSILCHCALSFMETGATLTFRASFNNRYIFIQK